MSDFSTGKFRAWKTPQKRPRESLVCNQCRKSKLKCDKAQPCSSCVKRDGGGSCSYQRPVAGSRVQPTTITNGNSRTSVEDRLAHLESLVKKVIEEQGSTEDESPAEEVGEVAELSQNENGVEDSYAGFTHWSTILDEIQGLKGAVAEAQGIGRPPPATGELIFGSAKDYSLQDIISQHLPSREEVDRILNVYFDGEVFILPFIHRYQFEREVREFWNHPLDVDPLWLSILFSVCYTESIIHPAINPTGGPVKPGNIAYNTAAAQCLVLGEYHRPQQHGLEALALYAHCKSFGSLDPSREAGAILGFVIRMAYEMGYHRDPDSFGTFTPFESEMRRRFWATCKQLDLMISFMLGLPSNICLENCDTKSPKNLLDTDFDVDTKVLPPCRTENQITKLLWFTVKDRQMTNFGKVCRNALSFKEMSEVEIFELDKEIREMYESIPVALRARPVAESKVYGPFIIIVRLYIELIHLKSICVLHRRYITQGRAFSTKACLEAGKSIVSQFIDMYNEFAPGGYLHKSRWMLGSYTMNDFLLGVMVLCLILHHQRKSGDTDSTSEEELIALLHRSYEICVEKSQASRDARRVSYAIKLVLDNVKLPTGRKRTKSQGQIIPEIVPTIDPSLLSLDPQLSYFQDSPFGLLDPFQFAGSDVQNIDWEAFDQEMLGSS